MNIYIYILDIILDILRYKGGGREIYFILNIIIYYKYRERYRYTNIDIDIPI